MTLNNNNNVRFGYLNGSRASAISALKAGTNAQVTLYVDDRYLATGECWVEPELDAHAALSAIEQHLLERHAPRPEPVCTDWNCGGSCQPAKPRCPECGQPEGDCYAICPTQGLAEWERHYDQHVAPHCRDHLTEGYGDPDPYEAGR